MGYIQRNIEKTILNLCNSFRIIGITGPRQSGKSTTVKHLLGNKYQYISFDNIEHINNFTNNPQSFLKKYDKYVIFDEVQNVPDIFQYIKIIVDDEPEIKGRFVLTGSSQFTLNQNITESLAGRIALVNMLPLDINEIPDEYQEKSIFLGSYPELIVNSFRSSDFWYSSYISTYIERDVRKLQNVGDLRDFQRFLFLISSYISKQINLTEISNEIGISVNTVKRWISILEASFLIFFLSPYYKNFHKRITKTPKLYFYDTGLAAYLMGLYGNISFDSGAISGQFFENYIVSEVIKKKYHFAENKKIFFFRTSGGREVDLLIESANEILLAEVKLSQNFKPMFAKNLESLEIPAREKLIIYRGENISYKKGFDFSNYKDFLKKI